MYGGIERTEVRGERRGEKGERTESAISSFRVPTTPLPLINKAATTRTKIRMSDETGGDSQERRAGRSDRERGGRREVGREREK